MYRTYQLADHHRERLSQVIEQPIIPLSENIADYLKEYFALLSHASCDESFKMDSKLADLSLQTILTSIQIDVPELFGKQSFEP